MDITASFPALLRQARINRDLTQEALAETVGCATQTIRSFEIGRRRPSREMAARLADVLEVLPDERATFISRARARLDILSSKAAGEEDTQPAPRPPLSTPPTSFIGRQHEQAGVLKHFTDLTCRLVTVVGPGGAGKTRLALQVATALASRFSGGAAFVPFAAVTSAEHAADAITEALGERLQGNASPTEQVLRLLRDREMLLVLDNLEHLLQVADLVARILDEAPRVRMLATSRERLRLQAEWVVELAGLGVPATDSGEEIPHAEAVMLFLERARRANSAFALGPNNQAAVAQICRRLDGLPLALELAAAQVSFLSPAALLKRLDQALPLLESGARDLPVRQRTMRAAIGWSYDLLSVDERTLFQRMAVFAGSWSLEAAEAVGAGGTISSEEVLGLMRRLVEQSLVVCEPAGETIRYRLLEPIRQYLNERLATQPEETHAACRRHADYFVVLAEQAAPQLQGADQIVWLDRLEREHPNLREAMAWLLAQGDLAAATRLGWALWLFLWLRGYFSLWRRWVEQILDQSDRLPPAVYGRALLAANVLAFGQADYQAVAPRIETTLALYRTLDDRDGLSNAVSMAALSAMSLGQLEWAEALMQEGVERFLDLNNAWGAAMLLTYWSTIPLGQGNYGKVKHLTEQSLGLSRSLGDRVGVYSSLFTLARMAQEHGDYGEATRMLREAMTLSIEMGDDGNLASCLESAAGIAAAHGQLVVAAQVWGAAGALREGREAAVYAYAPDRAAYAQAVAAARAQLTDTQWRKAWAAGRTLSREQIVALVDDLDLTLRSRLASQAAVPNELPGATPPRQTRALADLREPLTAREIEVLQLLAAGHPNQAIADRLVVAVGTVKRHVNSIFGKLGAHTRTQAVAHARERGLL